jgi:hypothetical protein
MQRIGKQNKAIGYGRTFGRKHRRLPPAVGLATQKYSARRDLPQSSDSGAKPGAILGRPGRMRRSVGARLPERKIATQYRHPGLAKTNSEMHQKVGAAVPAGPMR